MGRGAGGKEEGEAPVKQDPELLADERCSQAVLDFISATDVGRLFPAEEAARSEVPEWSVAEREQERREGREVGAGEEVTLFLPTPSFMASARDE